jgi:hypothetical protein
MFVVNVAMHFAHFPAYHESVTHLKLCCVPSPQPANEWPLKSNGVSGHFFYISYQILLTHYLACLYTGARDRKYRLRMYQAARRFRLLSDLLCCVLAVGKRAASLFPLACVPLNHRELN